MKSTTCIGRLLIVLVAVVFVAGMLQTAFAQGQGMRLSPKQRADTLGKQLSLDSVTVVKVTKIFEKYQKEMTDKRNELQGDMDGMRAAMTEIRDKQNKEITALLTKEQATKYEEIQKQQQQRMMNRPPRNN
jgi:Skp family chaperone for outer membrane proteins